MPWLLILLYSLTLPFLLAQPRCELNDTEYLFYRNASDVGIALEFLDLVSKSFVEDVSFEQLVASIASIFIFRQNPNGMRMIYEKLQKLEAQSNASLASLSSYMQTEEDVSRLNDHLTFDSLEWETYSFLPHLKITSSHEFCMACLKDASSSTLIDLVLNLEDLSSALLRGSALSKTAFDTFRMAKQKQVTIIFYASIACAQYTVLGRKSWKENEQRISNIYANIIDNLKNWSVSRREKCLLGNAYLNQYLETRFLQNASNKEVGNWHNYKIFNSDEDQMSWKKELGKLASDLDTFVGKHCGVTVASIFVDTPDGEIEFGSTTTLGIINKSAYDYSRPYIFLVDSQKLAVVHSDFVLPSKEMTDFLRNIADDLVGTNCKNDRLEVLQRYKKVLKEMAEEKGHANENVNLVYFRVEYGFAAPHRHQMPLSKSGMRCYVWKFNSFLTYVAYTVCAVECRGCQGL
ncbi:hypothetical protein L596_016853 [Steinernema carpocapsae]|uniref:Uncharacterized protein n=1 Tax=Steinernema carpocapsae TaxID=34508 RepID=A0A4U5NJ75_STECR|nr:hypothetical protein L596_016853 [Steinernema carpocapsae]